MKLKTNMAKINKLQILEGAVAGVAMGVAAAMFLTSKTGKKVTQDVKDYLADFYHYIAPKVKKMENMGEAEYHAFMKDAVEKFGKARKMSGEKIAELAGEVKKSWKHFSKHLGQ